MPATLPDMRSPSRSGSGVVVPHSLRWHQRWVAALIYGLLRLLSCSIRYEWREASGFSSKVPAGPVVFCIWHNRLALCLEVHRRYLRRHGSSLRLAAMVSASKDGGLLARVLEHYDVQPVRGSTSRRGRQALLELTTWAERGYDLALTPDGPRGPRYKVQDGVMSLAQLTGHPIVPMSLEVTWKIRLRSWDAFQLPLPLSKCVIHVGAPICVPREASEAERAKLRVELEEQLRTITHD